ncbi:MAG: EAL domain-containing protein, partial [Mycobacterium sp.]
LPAAGFIELAEETGVIAALDATVLATVGQQLQTWGRQFDAPDVAVNRSPRTLASDSLISALTASGIHHPDRLWIEFTESVLMTDMAGVAARLDQLRGLGVRIAIDDFGTGHSSLTYLQRLPIDAIKIDKTFVDRLGRDPTDTAIVTAVVTLGHTIGVRVVAEGVETERQRDLTELGCDYAQGHLIPRPSPSPASPRCPGRPAAHDGSDDVAGTGSGTRPSRDEIRAGSDLCRQVRDGTSMSRRPARSPNHSTPPTSSAPLVGIEDYRLCLVHLPTV